MNNKRKTSGALSSVVGDSGKITPLLVFLELFCKVLTDFYLIMCS